MIIRRKRIRNWTSFPNEIWEDPQLSFKAKGILAYLLSRPSAWRANRHDLSAHSTDGIGSIRSGMIELAKTEYAKLCTTIDKNTRKATGTQWVVTDTKGDFSDDSGSEVCSVKKLDCQAAAQSVFEPLSNTDNSKDVEEVSTKAQASEAEVWSIYEAYPRHIGRRKALIAIRNALRDVPFQELIQAVREYADCANGSEKKFIPYPATWFNQGRWQDDRTEWRLSCKQTLTPSQLNEAIKRLEKEAADWKNRHTTEYAMGIEWDSLGNKETYRGMKKKLDEWMHRYTEMISQ